MNIPLTTLASFDLMKGAVAGVDEIDLATTRAVENAATVTLDLTREADLRPPDRITDRAT